MKKILAHVPNKMKYFAAALLAVLVIAGLLPVGLNLFANADNIVGDYTYGDLPEVTVNGTTGTAPAGGIKRNDFARYTSGGQEYVFKAVRDIAGGETMTIDGSSITLAPRSDDSIADNLSDLVEVTSSGNVYTLTLKPDTLLEAGTPYFYSVGGNSYSITPTQDIGYVAPDDADGDARTDTVNPKSFSQSKDSTGPATITIDTDAKTLSVSAKQYTKKVIYHETNSFTSGKVYLIGAKTDAGNSNINIIERDETRAYTVDRDTGYTDSNCVHYSADETVYSYKLTNQWANYNRTANANLVQFSGSTSPYSVTNGSANSISTTGFNYYFEDNDAGDAWVGSELKTQYESNTFTSGNILMAYDATKKNYTQDRVFGSVNSSDTDIQSRLHFHKDCFGKAAVLIDHNNGNIWTYTTQNSTTGNKYGYMKNGNTLSTNVLQALNGNPNLYFGGSLSPATSASSTPLTGTRNTSSPIYLFEKKTVYQQDIIETTEKATPETSGTGLTMTGHPLRSVKATLDYDGAKISGADSTLTGKQFTVAYTLTDFDGLPVNGTFSLDGFTSGTETMEFVGGRLESNILMKDAAYVQFVNGLPEGFTLTPTILDVTNKSDADRGNYTFMQGPNGVGTYSADYIANGTAVTVDGDEDIRLDVRDPKREVDIRLSYSANGTLKNKDFTLTLYMDGPDGQAYNGTLYDSAGNQYTFTNGECSTRILNGSTTESAIPLHNGQALTLTGVPNGSQIAAEVTGGMADYDNTPVYTCEGNTYSKDNKVSVTGEDKARVSASNDKSLWIAVTIKEINMTLTLDATDVMDLDDYGVAAYIDVYKISNGDTENGTLLKRTYIGGAYSSTVLSSDKLTISIPNLQYTEDVYVKIYGIGSGVSKTGVGTFQLNDNTIIGSTKSVGKSSSYQDVYSSSSWGNTFTTSYSNSPSKILYTATKGETSYRVWSKLSSPNITLTVPHQPSNTIYLKGVANLEYETNLNQHLLHGNKTKAFSLALLDWKRQSSSEGVKVDSKVVWPCSMGALVFNPATETATAETYTEGIKLTGSSTSVRKYTEVGDEVPLTLTNDDAFAVVLQYASYSHTTGTNVNETATTAINSGYLDARSNSLADGYRTTYQITAAKGTYASSASKLDIPYSSGSTNITSSGKKRAVVSAKDQKHIHIFQDIIPQEVKVTLNVDKDSDGTQNYADKKRKFKVKVVLVRDSGDYAEDESYQVLTQSISNFDDSTQSQVDAARYTGTEVTCDSNGDVIFDGRNGATFEMVDGDELYLQLPWGYKAVVTSNALQGDYTTSYETREEATTSTNNQYKWQNATVTTSTVSGNATAAQTNYIEANDVNQAVMPLSANERITDQEIKVIKTRNAVPDDIGLFGGRTNRAFLALVSALSIAAAAAYIYTKRHSEQSEDTKH